jgi:hypothetical protein
MVNNSANINKTSNHLSSHPTEHNNIPGHMMLEMKDLAWDKHNNVAGLNMSILLCESLFDMCEILNGATLVWLSLLAFVDLLERTILFTIAHSYRTLTELQHVDI